MRRAELGVTEWHLPDREEIAQRKSAPNRRFDVYHAVFSMCVNPVKTRAVTHERSGAAIGHLPRLADADAERDLLLLAVEKDGQVNMDVFDRRFERVA